MEENNDGKVKCMKAAAAAAAAPLIRDTAALLQRRGF